MYSFHRIFCATPFELDAEWRVFHDTLSEFNEAASMPRGILLVPVSLANMTDKRPMQALIDENIRDCRYYLLVHTGRWGPNERNFQYDYHYAMDCLANPSLPMAEVVTLYRAPVKYIPVEPVSPDMPVPNAEFSSPAEFRQLLWDLFTRWLASFPA